MRLRRSIPPVLLLALLLPVSPLEASPRETLLGIAGEIDGLAVDCDWLARDVQRWMADNGTSAGYFEAEAQAERDALLARGKGLESRIEGLSNEEIDAAEVAALSALGEAQRDLCERAGKARGTFDGFRAEVDTASTEYRHRKEKLEALLGQRLDAPAEIDPQEFARRQAEWDRFVRQRAEEERQLAAARQAREEAERRRREERKAEIAAREDRSAARRNQLYGQVEPDAPPPLDPEKEAAMRHWHEDYRPRSAEVRKGLGSVLQAVRGTDDTALQGRCAELRRRLERFLADPVLLDVPDPQVEFALRLAYGKIRVFASDCASGERETLAAQMEGIQRALGGAAQLLAPYSLKP